MDEATLKSLFEQSQEQKTGKMQFSPEESSRFKKAFEDEEFRKLFASYVDELQDPNNRQETEDYITQLEGEKKVPEGKELIRYIDTVALYLFLTVVNLLAITGQKLHLLRRHIK